MMKVIRRKITIYGLVQGVGFRPFVAEQAEILGIAGTVQNMGGIVRIFAEGEKEALDEFVHRLSVYAPKGARVDRVEVSEVSREKFLEEMEGIEVLRENPCSRNSEKKYENVSEEKSEDENKSRKFFIIESRPAKDMLRFLPPDIATCDFCKRELFDEKNRRYRYPFISCTACGPRFSIMERVPYDRDTITMKEFLMCPECEREYLEKGNIRRHAQTIACGECGPRVRLYEYDLKSGKEFEKILSQKSQTGGRYVELLGRESEVRNSAEFFDGDGAVRRSIELLKQGKILAVKDIGGFHFAFDPGNREAAKRLREFKHRERKPFAVMFPECSDIEAYCEVSDTERKLLTSPARPIVLLKKKEGMDFVPEVCVESRFIGAMLPCNPLQMLLLRETGPLVMTSGNRGGEPMITDEEELFAFWEGNYNVPDAVLTHDRRILYGLDDSIFQVTVCGAREVVQVIRRARGLVPEPVRLPGSLSLDTFAAGGDLKAVFALGRKNMAYLSPHFGDLEEVQAGKKRLEALKGMCALLGISPKQAVCDKHPGYVSVRKLEEDLCHINLFSDSNDIKNSGKEDLSHIDQFCGSNEAHITKCQHHHAHIAAVMAEHSLTGQVLGVAYDGTGYGEDGTVWGGEFLVCEGKGFRRAGHLESVLLTGGDAASKNALITAYCYLYAAKEKGYFSEGEFEKAVSCIFDEKDESQKAGFYNANYYDYNKKEMEIKKAEKQQTEKQCMILEAALKKGINTVHSSSMGRLFDAAAAVLGICGENSYEGECPEKLETQAEGYLERVCAGYEDQETGFWNGFEGSGSQEKFKESGNLRIPVYEKEGVWISDGAFLISSLIKERLRGVPKERLAYGFHQSIADMTVRMCEVICEHGWTEKRKETEGSKVESTEKIRQIALGGGTMFNRLLLKLLIPALENRGYKVYVNEKVPSGDGGLAYGQMALMDHTR